MLRTIQKLLTAVIIVVFSGVASAEKNGIFVGIKSTTSEELTVDLTRADSRSVVENSAEDVPYSFSAGYRFVWGNRLVSRVYVSHLALSANQNDGVDLGVTLMNGEFIYKTSRDGGIAFAVGIGNGQYDQEDLSASGTATRIALGYSVIDSSGWQAGFFFSTYSVKAEDNVDVAGLDTDVDLDLDLTGLELELGYVF